MSQIDERQRSINAKIERLRTRLRQKPIATEREAIKLLAAVLAGLLDLLGDEL